MTFRAKLAKAGHFSNRGMYPDELGVVIIFSFVFPFLSGVQLVSGVSVSTDKFVIHVLMNGCLLSCQMGKLS